jgi:hypothetical protein
LRQQRLFIRPEEFLRSADIESCSAVVQPGSPNLIIPNSVHPVSGL